MRQILAVALLAAIFVPINVAYADPGGSPYVPGEIIVKYKQDTKQSDKQQIRAQVSGQKIKELGRIRTELQRIQGMTVEEAIRRLQNDPRIEYVEPNYIRTIDETPNDPKFPQLWGFENTGQTGGIPGADISATNAWDVFKGSDTVIVGVVDTGVDYNHVDLAANMWINPGEIAGNGIDDDNNGYIDDIHGWDFHNNDNDPMDDHSHGTHVAGTIGAVGNNGTGVSGVNWNIQIIAAKFIGEEGWGTDFDAVRAIDYMIQMGVRIINASWGSDEYSQFLYDAVDRVGQADILFVANSGNSGSNTDLSGYYPASYDLANIVSVAATNHNDQLAGFSNYGTITVDLGAPGVDILSTIPGNLYGLKSGTSMAAPHVSGALGLVFGQFPAIGHLDAKNRIMSFTDPIPALSGICVTGGRLNAFLSIAEPDSLPPGAILDLAVTGVGSSSMGLSWTAPGDDGNTGTSSGYDIRYATSPIDALTFASAVQVTGEPDPSPSGTPETMTVDGLDFNTSYHFAAKAWDEFANEGGLSNVPGGTTLGAPDVDASPMLFTENLSVGDTSVRTLTLSNLAVNTTLDFDIPLPELLGTSDPVIEGFGGPDGLGIAFDSEYLRSNFAIRISAIPQWLTVTPATGTILGPGAQNLDITFDASGLLGGVHDGNVRIFTNDPDESPLVIPVQLTVVGVPDITAEPLTFDYGETFLGATPTYGFSVGNQGSDSLRVSNVTIDHTAYAPAMTSFVVPPLASVTLEVTFAPAGTVGLYPATMTITSNDPDEPTFDVALSGEGVEAPAASISPTSLTSNLFIGGTDTQVLTLSNTGGAALEWSMGLTVFPSAQMFNLAAPVNGPDVDSGVEEPQISSGPVQLELRDLSGIRIMLDRSHGQRDPAMWSTIIGDLEARGATVTVNHNTLTPSVLWEYDVLWSMDVNAYFSEAELTALEDWLRTGGAILLEVDHEASRAVFNEMLTAFAAGFRFASPPIDVGDATTIYPHPTTMNVTGVYFSTWDRASINGAIVAPAQRLVEDNNGLVGAAASEVGHGRIVGVADEVFQNDRMDNADNRQFGNQVFDWISGSKFIRINPTAGTILPGGSEIVDVTFDATDFFGGRYDADIEIGTNDPLASNIVVPATMFVTGVPDIEVEPLSLNYGLVYVPYPEALEFTITNTGTDLLTVTALDSNNPRFQVNFAGITLPLNLNPEQTALIQVGFTPNLPQPESGILSVVSNDADEPTVEIALSGEGLLPPLAGVSPDSLHADLFAGDIETQQVTLSNTGGSNLEWSVGLTVLPSAQMFNLAAPINGPDVDSGVEEPQISSGPVQLELRDLSGIRIMLDRSHGQRDPAMWSTIIGDLEARGATVTVNHNTLTPSVLGEYDVLWSMDVNSYFSEAELTALEDWLSTGGAILLEVDHEVSRAVFNEMLIAFAAGFRFAFPAIDVGDATTIYPHPTTMNVTGVYFSTWDRASINGAIVAPAQRLVEDNNGMVGAAASEVGHGRIVGVADEVFQNDHMDNADNRQFGNQVFDWISGSGFISLDPTAGTILPGGSEIVDVTFDATGFFGGRYDSEIKIRTNDPANPELDVPATMQVTGVPRLTWEPDPLDFGDIFVGYPDTLSLTISNVGTAQLTISAMTAGLPGWFVSPSSLTMAPWEEAAISVTLDPQAAGIWNTVLTIESNDPDSPHMAALHASGLLPPATGVSPDSLHADLFDVDSETQQLTVSNMGSSDLEWETVLTFLSYEPNLKSNMMFRNQVMNGLASPAFFTVSPNSGVVPAGGTAVVDVTFDTTDLLAGNYSGLITFLSNDPSNPELDVPATMQITPAPRVSWKPEPVDFGELFVGYPDTMSLTVLNVGTVHLSVASMISGLSDWSVDPAALELDVGDSAEVLVAFDPQTNGDRSTILTILSNDPHSPHGATLNGHALYPPIVATTPDSLKATAPPGGAAIKMLTLCNTGGSDLVWSMSWTEVAAAQVFTLATPDPHELTQDTDIGTPAVEAGITTPIQAELADLTGINIMWDRNHGQTSYSTWTTIIGDLESRGATVTINYDSWTLVLLASYDAIWSEDADTELTAAELAAFSAWVGGGGSVLLEGGDRPGTVTVFNGMLEAISAGIEFSPTPGGPTGVTALIFPHPITENVGQIFLSGVLTSLTNIADPGGLLFTDYTGVPIGAYSNVGGGRIVCLSDDMLKNSMIDRYHNRLFGNQVMDWLSLTRKWLTVSPKSGVLSAGECTDLTVLMDASELAADNYEGVIFVSSNDPVTPHNDTPLMFHVSESTADADEPEPTVHALLQNTPNPFRNATRITFDLPEEGHVDLRVYDLQGHVVRILKDNVLPAGSYNESWDGQSDTGVSVASGVYFYYLRAGKFVATRRMVLIR